MTAVFTDLFAYGQRSIAWVQIHSVDGGGTVVLVTEPSDNPGQSAVNAAERLVHDLHKRFPTLGPTRVFVRFLTIAKEGAWTELLPGADEMNFRTDVTVQEVEQLCPAAAKLEWRMEDWSCAALGGPRHPLLELIPAPEPECMPVAELAVVAVADLPWAHNPAGCSHIERFRMIEALYPDESWTPPAVGAQWFVSLTGEDFQECDYHAVDWVRIAATSVKLLEALDDDATHDEIVEAVTAKLGEAPEAGWCLSLFTDPIVCKPNDPRVTNGQHRLCALRASGATLCVVDTGGRRSSELKAGDPRRRASAEIAQYWARRAAR